MAYGRRSAWSRTSSRRSAPARGRRAYSRSRSTRRTIGRRTATRSGRQEIVLRIEGVGASGVSRPSPQPRAGRAPHRPEESEALDFAG